MNFLHNRKVIYTFGYTNEKNMITYANKYGTLTLAPIADYAPIEGISYKNGNVPDDVMFDMDLAEKIVLITDNSKSQIAFPLIDGKQFNKAYFIHHDTASTVAVCKIVDIDFVSDVNPTQEIADCAKKNSARNANLIFSI